MVKLRFYWDGCATFEDEDEYTEMELVENYEGDSWKVCGWKHRQKTLHLIPETKY